MQDDPPNWVMYTLIIVAWVGFLLFLLWYAAVAPTGDA